MFSFLICSTHALCWGGDALRRVPRVAARAPRQLPRERLEQVVQHPRDDDVVVDTDEAGHEHHAPAQPCHIDSSGAIIESILV